MRVTHTWTDETATIRVEGLTRSVRVLHVADSHILSDADQQIATYKDARTSYLNHFANRRQDSSGNDVPTEQTLAEMLGMTSTLGLDLVALTGDMLHCIAPASVEAVSNLVAATTVPSISSAGNHEWWHFQDLPDLAGHDQLQKARNRDEIRSAWWATASPDGRQPPFEATEIGGIRFAAIDDANYHVTEEQLAFVKKELGRGLPVVLLLHIPLRLPTLREPTIAVWDAPILIGDPDWAPESRHEWETREDDPETLEFVRVVEEAPNLVAVLCGHIHFEHVDSVSLQAVQYAVRPAYEGGYRLVEFRPLKR